MGNSWLSCVSSGSIYHRRDYYLDFSGRAAGIEEKIHFEVFCRTGDVVCGGGAAVVCFFHERISEAGLERGMSIWLGGLFFRGQVRPLAVGPVGNGGAVFGGGLAR